MKRSKIIVIIRLQCEEQGIQEENCEIDIKTLNYNEMLYFVVVTISTVGYGDIVPRSEWGRFFVMCFIIVAIVVLPQQTNELIRLRGIQSEYERNYFVKKNRIPFLILCGDISVDSLKNFCKELFHQDHGNNDKNAVILQQTQPSVETEIFLNTPQYELFLNFIQGSPFLEKDLRRVSASKADACVVLSSKYVKNSYESDHKNILTSIAIKKYVKQNEGRNLKMCLQLIKPESKKHYFNSINSDENDKLIIVEEIKMNLLAKSCYSPGIISLLGNLVRSWGDFVNYLIMDVGCRYFEIKMAKGIYKWIGT